MSRKLKKILKSSHTSSPKRTLKDIDLESKPKKILRYKKQRCSFIMACGNQCTKYAVGKSSLCKKHGGDPVIKENLIKKDELSLVGVREKFDPTRHPTLFIDLSRQGLSEVEIAAEFEVAVTTLRNWSEKYEMFNIAFDIGKALHESWWLQQGKAGLNNRGFNTSLFKFLTSNKLGYSDKMETKNMNMNVHGVLMVPDKVTEEEWENDGDIIDA